MYVCMCLYYIRIIRYIRKYHTYHQHSIASFGTFSTFVHIRIIHKCHAIGWHISLTTLCWWCSSPSEVELALETTFARDKKRFQYADVNHDGGVDNEEFIYFLHPEYNKEAVRDEGRGSEFVCVCVCVPMVAHTLWRQPCVAITRIPTPHPSPSDDVTGRRPHKETGQQP